MKYNRYCNFSHVKQGFTAHLLVELREENLLRTYITVKALGAMFALQIIKY